MSQKYSGTIGDMCINTIRTLAIDRFGASAPGETVMEKFGLTADHVVSKAMEILAR